MLPNARGAETDYLEWTARKRTGLRRFTLDCGHPNAGEVFYHAWCDRLSCSEACANGVHECGEYAGVKSGSEEESEPVEPRRRAPGCACPEDMAENEYMPGCPPCDAFGAAIRGIATLPVERTHIAITTEYDLDGSATRDRVGDAMRAEVLRQGLTECEIDDVRWNYWDGQWMPAADVRVMTPEEAAGWRAHERLSLECSRHRPMCSGCDGEAIDHGRCIHGCHPDEGHDWSAPGAPPVDAAVQPEMSECRNDSDIPTRPWWHRLFPGRSTR